jgi:hypothetical protein
MSTARKTTKPESVDVLIVGAGHAGLAMSGLLTHEGREHVVVERRQTLGGGWQDRWDEFTLVTPNWTASFPGWAYDGNDPHGFMSRDEIAARVARYAEVVRAPVGLGTEVHRLVRTGDKRFRVTTSRGALSARQVVVATGSYHRPRVPEWASSISGRVTQLHAHDTGIRPGCPRAVSSWSAPGRRGCSSPRSCTRPVGLCTSRSDQQVAFRVATAAATSSAGSPTSSAAAPRSA